MNQSTLFLICPDCHLEGTIQKHFQGNAFFLTALGSVFDTSKSDYAESITSFICSENIKDVIIINDSSCQFIQSVINNKKGYDTDAEEVLNVLHSNCQIEILAEKQVTKRAIKLAELNIKHQAHSLKETRSFEIKVEKKDIELKGMIYERDNNIFSEINLD